MGKRDGAVDLVRVLGILAIVAGHVWFTDFTWLALYPWHVPVFFFLSGYLWKTRRPFKTELAARSRALLKPYAFWFVILLAAFVVVLIRSGAISPQAVVLPIYGGFYAGRPFTTFWFVFVLFAAAVFYRFMQYIPLWARAAILAMALASSVFAGELLARTPLAIGSALPALLFIAAGDLARTAQNRMRGSWLIGLVLLIAGAVLVVSGLSAPVNIKQGDWGTPVLSVVVACALSWGVVMVAQAATRSVPEWAHDLFTSVALAGFTVVLVHPAVLWALGADPTKGNVLSFAVAFLIPMVIGLVALRTRLSQWVTGVPRLGRRAAPLPPRHKSALPYRRAR